MRLAKRAQNLNKAACSWYPTKHAKQDLAFEKDVGPNGSVYSSVGKQELRREKYYRSHEYGVSPKIESRTKMVFTPQIAGESPRTPGLAGPVPKREMFHGTIQYSRWPQTRGRSASDPRTPSGNISATGDVALKPVAVNPSDAYTPRSRGTHALS